MIHRTCVSPSFIHRPIHQPAHLERLPACLHSQEDFENYLGTDATLEAYVPLLRKKLLRERRYAALRQQARREEVIALGTINNVRVVCAATTNHSNGKCSLGG
jgi:hypothetical protein